MGITPPIPAPGQPGPFSLSDADRLRAILLEAGFQDVAVDGHADQLAIPETDIPRVARLSSRVGPVRQMLEDADTETADRVSAGIEEALRSRVDDGEACVGRAVFVVTAIA
jgi:hypothetical protein